MSIVGAVSFIIVQFHILNRLFVTGGGVIPEFVKEDYYLFIFMISFAGWPELQWPEC